MSTGHSGAGYTGNNTRRFHQALGNRTPMAVWREGAPNTAGGRAVNMTDSASALTTGPQQQQQTAPLAA